MKSLGLWSIIAIMQGPERRKALLSADTSYDAEAIQIELWRRMSPVDKARAITNASRAAQELSLAGIRLRHPDASERECRLRLAALKLGTGLTLRVYPEAAALFGR
jgi:hypothetical protein